MECPYLRVWLIASCVKGNPPFNPMPCVLNGYCRSKYYKFCFYYRSGQYIEIQQLQTEPLATMSVEFVGKR
jgi:hypothetical protein